MREIKIVYIDDHPDPGLSRYLDTEFSSPLFRKSYEEIAFNPAEGYESLIKNSLVQQANIIIIDSMLFENGDTVSGKFTGEEFKIILKKYYPFIEVIVITQNEPESAMGTISKYNPSCGSSASEYYQKILPDLINNAYSNIEKYFAIAEKLSKNRMLDKYLVEKVTNSLNGINLYDELTKSDINNLIAAFQRIEK